MCTYTYESDAIKEQTGFEIIFNAEKKLLIRIFSLEDKIIKI